MNKEELRLNLKKELNKYSSWTYDQFINLNESIGEEYGKPGTDCFYQVTVSVLEYDIDDYGEYIIINVSVNDGIGEGRSKLIFPEQGVITLYKDGTVDYEY